MSTKYARTRVAMRSDEINKFLEAGWEVITAQFCAWNHNQGGQNAVEYVPHALMGMPVELAAEQMAEKVAENVWTNPVPVAENVWTNPTQAPVEAPAAPALAVSAPAPVAAQPIGARPIRQASPPSSVERFTAPVNPQHSEEVVIGVRR